MTRARDGSEIRLGSGGSSPVANNRETPVGLLNNTCIRRYGRATLTIRRWGGLSELLGDSDLSQALRSYREDRASAAEVGSAFVATRVEAHSPAFAWETAEQARLLEIVATCSMAPVFGASDAKHVADQLLVAQDTQREQIRRAGEQITKQMQPALAAINQLVSRAALPAQSLAAQWKRSLEPLRRQQKRLDRALGAITATAQKAGRVWREFLELQERFPLVMMELGWPPPADVPAPLAARVVAGFDDLGADPTRAEKDAYAETVGSWVLDCHDEDLIKSKLADWRSKRLLTKRMHILEAAVGAHCRGEYLLSIPPLLAQAEGIIADGFSHQGQMDGKALKKYVQRLFDSGVKSQIVAAVNKAVVVFWQGILYTRFEHGQPIASPLSRHAVLHGGDVDYGTADGSLKAILLIDLFQSSFTFTVVDGSAVYHAGDCAALSRAKGTIRFLKQEQEAIDEGRRPCRKCLPT